MTGLTGMMASLCSRARSIPRTRLRHMVQLGLFAVLAGGPSCAFAGEDGRFVGNGVMVASSGLILTTRAAAAQCDSYEIRSSEYLESARKVGDAELLAISPTYELALLRADVENEVAAAPILVGEGLHVFAPTAGTRIAHGAFVETNDVGVRKLQPAFGVVREAPDVAATDRQPPNVRVVDADTRAGAGLFDMDGNLVGLVIEAGSQSLTQRLRDAGQWPENSYGPPTFFHDLNAVAAFLSAEGVPFGYQTVRDSRRLPGDDLIHGWLARVTYEIRCL